MSCSKKQSSSDGDSEVATETDGSDSNAQTDTDVYDTTTSDVADDSGTIPQEDSANTPDSGDSAIQTDTESESETTVLPDSGEDTADTANFDSESESDSDSAADSNSKSDSDSDSLFDSDSNSDSDSAPDSDTVAVDTVVTTEQPLPVEKIKDKGGQLFSITTSERYVYYDVPAGLFQMEKTPNAKTQSLGSSVSGYSFQNTMVDDKYLYWLSGKNISKKAFESEDIQTIAVSDELFKHIEKLGAMIGDGEYIYLTDIGCGAIAAIPKTGGDTLLWTREGSNYASGSVTMAQSSDTIYCSAGDDYVTGGHVYEADKSQPGSLKSSFTVEDPDGWDHQVGPMVVVGDTMYFIANYGGQNIGWEKFYSLNLNQSNTTPKLILRINEKGNGRIFYQNESVYWLGTLSETIYKYDTNTKQITTRSIDDIDGTPLAPMEMDNKHFYLMTWEFSIWRAPIF